jgi:hypothetical protein
MGKKCIKALWYARTLIQNSKAKTKSLNILRKLGNTGGKSVQVCGYSLGTNKRRNRPQGAACSAAFGRGKRLRKRLMFNTC